MICDDPSQLQWALGIPWTLFALRLRILCSILVLIQNEPLASNGVVNWFGNKTMAKGSNSTLLHCIWIVFHGFWGLIDRS